MTEEQIENVDAVSPGRLLKEAREKVGLSQSDVAQRLNLRKDIIEAIDQDEYDRVASHTFAKGYLKAYAKSVHADFDAVMAAFESYNVGTAADMQSFSRLTHRKARDSRWMGVTYGVIGFIFLSSIIYWYQQSKAVKTVPVQPEIAQEQPVSTPAITTDQFQGSRPSDESEQLQTAEQAIEDKANQTTNSNEDQVEQGTAQAVNMDTAKQPQAEEKNIEKQVPVWSDSDVATLAQKESTPESDGFQKMTLEVKFTKECWYSIKDALGKVISTGIKQPNDVINLSGLAPFNFHLGVRDAVEIKLNSQPVDLSFVNNRGNPKFELPHTE
ncbi:RodZ domain-containing protein [Algicola sagamiensis]|uniref:RodZ domain-containing protein n=1 Tax=Algicola sagamiensis TaxID=163869 RepID=UPI00036BA7A8|nr:RodZ domain-containing protein [Algicola sagamiensis]